MRRENWIPLPPPIDWWSEAWRSHDVQAMSFPSPSTLPAVVSEISTIAVPNCSGETELWRRGRFRVKIEAGKFVEVSVWSRIPKAKMVNGFHAIEEFIISKFKAFPLSSTPRKAEYEKSRSFPLFYFLLFRGGFGSSAIILMETLHFVLLLFYCYKLLSS